MKAIILSASMLILSGCAGASPLDSFLPAPADTTATEFLGDDTPNVSLVPYNTLADNKAAEDAVDLKLAVYKAQGELAKKKLGFANQMYDNLSNGIWGMIILFLTTMGWIAPSPSEKHKVEAALHKTPPTA